MAEEFSRKPRESKRKKHRIEENEHIPGGSSRRAFSSENWDGEYMEFIESFVKERKKRRKDEAGGGGGEETVGAEEGDSRDPLMVLGFDIMHVIVSLLDARSVALSLLVSRGWNGVACSDRLWSIKMVYFMGLRNKENKNSGWNSLVQKYKCKELWLGKAHIPRISKVPGLSKLAAYSLSAMDGKRTRIMRDDLCDHVWEFHFTEAAPTYWRNLDPYWKGTGRLMRRYFHQDGSQTADPGDEVWGGHEACYSVVTGLEADGKIRQHYVRINRRPPVSVSRKQDWSWEMTNRFCCYSSIPDPDKDKGTGPLFLVM